MHRILFLFFILITSINSFSQGTWTQKANFGGVARQGAIGFSIGNKGYIGLGASASYPYTNYKDFWEWDKGTNSWTQKANYPGGGLMCGVGFSIGTKGYVGTGYVNAVVYNDFWEWNQTTNTWTQKTNFTGIARYNASAFVIGAKGYVCAGSAGGPPYLNDFWEYDPSTDLWTQKTNYPFTVSTRAAFAIGGKGYVCNGLDGSQINGVSVYEYDPSNNSWTQKANFGGVKRSGDEGFSINGKGYIGTGRDFSKYYSDFWEYDPTANNWVQKANFGGVARAFTVGFSIGYCGYYGTGLDASGNVLQDFWEYCPNLAATTTISASGSTTMCFGQNTTLTVSGGANYSWNTGDTSSSIAVSPSSTTTYSVIATNGCSCSSTNNIIITVIPCAAPVSSFSAINKTICSGKCVQFTDQSSGIPSTWQWIFSGGNPSSSSLQNPLVCYDSIGTYNVSLSVANTNGSDSSSNSNYILVNDCYCPDISIPSAFSPNSDNENDILIVEGTKCLKTFSLAIYNNWGEKVFETTDISKGWDGTYKEKKENSAVFTYYLEATYVNGNFTKKKGNISLVR